MAKLRLGNAPEFIPYTAKFTGWDGKEDTIKGKAVYRTRKQFGALIDGLTSSDTDEPTEKLTNEQLQEKVARTNALYLVDCILTWDIADAKPDAESLQQLADECPQAVTALMNAYREAVFEGRLGN